jgi:hypothetical protein
MSSIKAKQLKIQNNAATDEAIISFDSSGQIVFDKLIKDLPWLSIPVGQPFPLSLHIAGVERPPKDNPLFTYIELTAGLTGEGDYNEGLLINEDVDATAIDGNGHVDLRITAEINLPGSPAHGQIVNLINSEGRAIIAGETSGVNWADQHQRITGGVGQEGSANTGGLWITNPSAEIYEGALKTKLTTHTARPDTGSESVVVALELDSANSPDARASATTDGPTLIKSQTGVFFFRLPNVVGA